MDVQKLEYCRICGNKNLKTVVDLGTQALSGRFPVMNTPDPPSAPLFLVQCTGRGCCGLVQLGVSIPLKELYGPGYGYLSGMNNTMRNHLQAIAKTAEGFVSLGKGDMVLDIGSNDGTLLRAYTTPGLCRVGMDGAHFKRFYTEDDIVFIPEFFKKEVFFDDDRPKIITSIAMFYDLPDPNKFVSDIKSILHPDGIWIVEQLYLPEMLENNAFDAICHEHLEYYCIKQMNWLLEKHGLRAFNIEFNKSNGNSFRMYICHKESKRADISKPLWIMGETEHLDFKRFNESIKRVKNQMNLFIESTVLSGKRIHLYGASTKGNVLLQYLGIDYRMIECAAEKNSAKYGCWTPGTHIPIVSESASRLMNPDYYLVLPWHFKEEFIEREKQYLNDGGCLVFPLPVFDMVKI